MSSNFDSIAVTVSTFFGALTFTAMILLMQSADIIQYSEILIPWTAIVSFFFILSTLGIVNADVEKKHPHRFHRIVMFSFIMGIYGLIFIIPVLVYSFTVTGSIVIFILEIIMVAIFNTSIGKLVSKQNN